MCACNGVSVMVCDPYVCILHVLDERVSVNKEIIPKRRLKLHPRRLKLLELAHSFTHNEGAERKSGKEKEKEKEQS